MPCNGGNYFGRSREVGLERSYTQELKRAEHLTRMLCQALDMLDGHVAALPPELDEWWYEHRLKDEARTKEAKRRAAAETAKERRSKYLESVRERVVGQLTEDEIEALGLKD